MFRGEIPVPGTSKAKLISVGVRLFSELGYDRVDVKQVAAEAGVTIGSLYHHFKSKEGFYGALRDDFTLRILDRMEAVVEMAADNVLAGAVLAAYDGVVKTGAGKILMAPDPRGGYDPIQRYLAELAAREGVDDPEAVAALLYAAVQAALQYDHGRPAEERPARAALARLSQAGQSTKSP